MNNLKIDLNSGLSTRGIAASKGIPVNAIRFGQRSAVLSLEDRIRVELASRDVRDACLRDLRRFRHKRVAILVLYVPATRLLVREVAVPALVHDMGTEEVSSRLQNNPGRRSVE